MRLKYITIIIVVCLLGAVKSYAQTDQDAITNSLNSYFKSVQQSDHQKVLDLTYSKFFEVLPRENMLKALESINSDPNYVTTISENKIKNISEITVIDNIKYAKVEYSFKMTLQIYEQDTIAGDDAFDKRKFTTNLFKKQYGESNVTFDPKQNKYEINIEKQMIAVFSSSTKSWQFLGIEKGLRSMLERIFPKSLLEAYSV